VYLGDILLPLGQIGEMLMDRRQQLLIFKIPQCLVPWPGGRWFGASMEKKEHRSRTERKVIYPKSREIQGRCLRFIVGMVSMLSQPV
jgi:hypothetical protein